MFTIKRKLAFAFCILLSLVISFSGCDSIGGGTVIVTNNSKKAYTGKVWTDSKELFSGTIRAWNSKTFYVSENSDVYTDFESSDGEKSSPSGHVSRGVSLIFDL